MKAGSNRPHPLREIGEGHTSACCGIWTADGRYYVFEEARTGGTDLWAVKGIGWGATLTQLTNGPLHYFSPVAARSGHRIFFLGSDLPLGVQRFAANNREFVPHQAFLSNAVRVYYARDGRWVVWTDMDGRLWRARAADGSDKLQLTPSDVDVFSANWSPDGHALVLMARMQDQVWQIYQLDAGGGALKQLLRESRNDADPTWSPDGKSLAFGGEPDLMGKESGPHSIRILNAATGQVTTLPNSDGMFSPRWSPDGRWIAALSLDQKRVMLYDTAKRKWSQLAAISAADPAWSSDGKALYIHAFLEDKQPILRISVPSGEMQQVASLDDLRAKDAANYFFSGLTPDNEPLVLPRVGTSNLFTIDLDR
jgi:Tol biopolymer transport system component